MLLIINVLYLYFLFIDFENCNYPLGYHATSEQYAGIEQCYTT